MRGTSAGEVAKDIFEDLAVLAACPGMRHGGTADRALEATLTKVLRAVVNPQGSTAQGVAQGVSRFVAARYPARDEEDDTPYRPAPAATDDSERCSACRQGLQDCNDNGCGGRQRPGHRGL